MSSTKLQRLAPCYFGLAFAILVASAREGHAAGKAGTPNSKQWALILAVRDYADPKVPDLNYTVRDAELIRKTLKERAGLTEATILAMTDESPGNLKPTSANLRDRIGPFLAKAAPEDRVVVFYSGHGMLQDGRTVLLPSDYDAEKPATGLPVAALRQALAKCQAKTKFLILDCCHAGNAKGDDPIAKDAGAILEDLKPKGQDDYVILASCRGEEKSLEWQSRQQGFFTFWLCHALEGGGDTNGDGQLTLSEVYDYTHDRVRTSVSQVFNNTQTQEPIQQVLGGNPVLLSLQPEGAESLCRRLADHIDLDVREKGLKYVGVRRFAQSLVRTESMAGATATANFAEKVRAELAKLAAADGTYKVSPNLLSGLGEEVAADPEAMAARAKAVGGIDGLVDGSLRPRGGRMTVSCELLAQDGNPLARHSGVLRLGEQSYGDLGASYAMTGRPPGTSHEVALTKFVEDRAQRFNPISPEAQGKEKLPYRIQIFTLNASGKRTERFIEFDGNSATVGVRKDEDFEIWLRNDSDKKVAVGLLVDGISTRSKEHRTLEELTSKDFWVLEAGKPYAIRHWYTMDIARKGDPQAVAATVTEAQAGRFEPVKLVATMKEANRLRFVDASKGLAAQRGVFTDGVGVITAAFYAEATGGMGTSGGEGEKEEVEVLNEVPYKKGALLGVINIKYVDESEMGYAVR